MLRLNLHLEAITAHACYVSLDKFLALVSGLCGVKPQEAVITSRLCLRTCAASEGQSLNALITNQRARTVSVPWDSMGFVWDPTGRTASPQVQVLEQNLPTTKRSI